jgi:hypothetical protein
LREEDKSSEENSLSKENMNYYFKIWLKKTVANVR